METIEHDNPDLFDKMINEHEDIRTFNINEYYQDCISMKKYNLVRKILMDGYVLLRTKDIVKFDENTIYDLLIHYIKLDNVRNLKKLEKYHYDRNYLLDICEKYNSYHSEGYVRNNIF